MNVNIGFNKRWTVILNVKTYLELKRICKKATFRKFTFAELKIRKNNYEQILRDKTTVER